MKKRIRRALMRWLFPEVIQFIEDLYATPRDPSYFIQLPRQPQRIKDLLP